MPHNPGPAEQEELKDENVEDKILDTSEDNDDDIGEEEDDEDEDDEE